MVVWIAAAVREAGTLPAMPVRGSSEIGMVVLAVAAVAATPTVRSSSTTERI